MSQTFSADELASERWLPTPYAGYDVSDLGRVRSRRKPGRGVGLRDDAVVLSPTPDYLKSGHLRIRLSGGGRLVRVMVHALVLGAFVGPRPSGLLARHFPDPDPTNNRLSNLSYGTHQQNADDRGLHGSVARGSRHGRAVLTEGAVRLMRWLRAEHGVTYVALGEWFGVGPDACRKAADGAFWTHVPPHGGGAHAGHGGGDSVGHVHSEATHH